MLKDSNSSKRERQEVVVTEDIEITAPKWLSRLLQKNRAYLKFKNRDGHAVIKGVKIDDEIAKIGDKIVFDGKWVFIERR